MSLTITDTAQTRVIRPDGSDRKFSRLNHDGRPAVLVGPPDKSAISLAEARSFFKIGTHLFRAGVPVPEIYSFDDTTGEIVMEDLGDTLMYHRVMELKKNGCHEETEKIYMQALRLLCQLQLKGTRGFRQSWCYDTPVYDGKFAHQREALYFRNAFLVSYLKLTPDHKLDRELSEICQMFDELHKTPCLIHRDFQSRNLMIKDRGLKLIDFQGARLGPWGYDAASLIFDPYTGLDRETRRKLAEFYITCATDAGIIDKSSFEKHEQFFLVCAMLRTMQALGAYAFLAARKGKSFFRAFFKPGVKNLEFIAGHSQFEDFVSLRQLAESLSKIDFS